MRRASSWAEQEDRHPVGRHPSILHPSQWLTPIALSIMTMGVVIVVGSITMLANERASATEQRQLRQVEDLTHSIELVLADYLATLRGLHGFVANDAPPDPEEFSRYVADTGVVHNVIGLWGVEWAAAPEGTSDLVSIELVEPADELGEVVGVNLGADPVRRGVIEATIDTGEPHFSPPIELNPIGGEAPATGLVAYQAVFDDGRFVGIVGAILEADALLAAAFPADEGPDFSIADLGTAEAPIEPSLLYESSPGLEFDGAHHRAVVNGRVWEISVGETPTGPLGGHLDELLLGLAGLVSVVFVSFTVGLLEVWGDLAERRAADLNVDLLAANDELEVASARLRQGMASAEVELWERDLETGDGWTSQSWASSDDATFDSFLERVHPDDRHLFSGDRTRRTEGQLEDLEFRLLVNGDYRWTLSRSLLIERDGRPIVMGAQFDITERRARLEETERLNRELRSSNQSLREFTRVASHDLRAPLRAIDALAGFLRDDLGDDLRPDVDHHLTRIEDRVERLRRLITDLLAYARADHRADTTEPVDIRQLIDDIVAGSEQQHDMPVLVDADLPVLVLSPTPIATCVRNLIDNAFKYHDRPDEGIVEIEGRYADGLLRITVSDDGPGIADDHREAIWEPFRRFVEADAQVAPGSGVGLSVIKRIAEAHDGSIRLEPSIGRGATFVLQWPAEVFEGVPPMAIEPNSTVLASG